MPVSDFLATSVVVSADLIEDYEHSVEPAAGPDVDDRFQAVRREGVRGTTVDLVSVHPEGGLVRAYADPASPSGWATERIIVEGADPATQPTSVRAFSDGSRLTVLARYADATGDALLAMVHTHARGWAPAPFDDDVVNALGAMTQTDVLSRPAGDFIYGVSLHYDPATFVVVAAGKKSWSVAYLEPAAPGTTYKLVPGDTADQLVLLEFFESSITLRQGSISAGRASFASGGTQYTSGAGDLVAATVTSQPSSEGHTCFVVLATDGTLVRFDVSGSTIQYVSLTGGAKQPGSLTSFSSGTRPDGSSVVFGLDAASGELWVGDLSSWTCLGDVLTAVATPAVLDEYEAFLFTPSGSIQHLARHGHKHLWTSATVRAGTTATTPARISSHAFEITALGTGEQPVAGVELQLSVDRVAVLVVDGMSQHVAPGAVVAARTGADGTLGCTVRAEDLTSPVLTVTATGIAPVSCRADARTHARLSGADPAIPVTGDALKQAQLVPDSTPSESADEAAAALRSLGAAAVHKAGNGPPPSPGKIVLSPASMARADPSPPRWPDGVPLDDDSLFGDVIHFLEQCCEDIAEITVDVTEDLIKLEVEIKGELLKLEADTVEEIGHAIRLVLAAIATAAEDVEDAIDAAIHWLRMVFDWSDILDTATVLQYFVEQALSNIKRDLPLVSDKVHDFAVKLEDEVEDAIDNLIKTVDPNLRLGDTVPPTSTNPMLQPGNPLLASGLRSASQDHAARCNYARRRAVSTFEQSPPLRAFSDDNPLTRLIQLFEQNYPSEKINASWEQIRSATADIQSPEDVLDLVLVVILEVAKDLILLAISGVETLVEELIDLLSDALDEFLALAEKPIDVPVLSWLYRDATGEDMTALGLLSLIAAVPITILYKIAQGTTTPTPPFPDPKQITNQPIPWWDNPSLPHPGPVHPDAGVLEQARAAIVLTAMGLYGIADMAFDWDAALRRNGQTPSSAETWGSAAVVFVEVVAQAFSYPSFDFTTEVGSWKAGAWFGGWTPILLDLLTTILAPKKALARLLYVKERLVGPWVTFVIGGVLMGIGAKAVDAMRSAGMGGTKDNAEETGLLLPTFPLVLQPIVLLGTKSEPTIIAQVCLLGVDLVSDFGTGVAFLIEMETS